MRRGRIGADREEILDHEIPEPVRKRDMEARGVLVAPAAVCERDLGDVELADRIDRGEDLRALYAIDEAPFLTEAGSLGQLVSDLTPIGRGVHGLDPLRPERQRLGVLEAPGDLHPIGAEDRLALLGEHLDRLPRESIPDLELPGIGRDRRVDGIGVGQRPVPEVLILDVAQQVRERLVRMEILPGQHRARMAEVEVELVALRLELLDQAGIAHQAVERGDVVVENDDLGGHVGELAQLVTGRGDVDEGDERSLAVAQTHAILVAARDEPGIVAPGAANGPGSAKAVRASSVVEAEFLQGMGVSWSHGAARCKPISRLIGRLPARVNPLSRFSHCPPVGELRRRPGVGSVAASSRRGIVLARTLADARSGLR